MKVGTLSPSLPDFPTTQNLETAVELTTSEFESYFILQISQISGTTQCLSFTVWLISLSNPQHPCMLLQMQNVFLQG